MPKIASALVEKQYAVDAGRLGEDPLQVLLGLTDIFVDHGREVHGVEVEPEVARDHLRRHRLAGAGVAGEQRGDPAAAAATWPHPPVGEHTLAVPGPSGQLAELAGHLVRQHQVGPADRRLDPAGEPLQAGRVLVAGALTQVGRLYAAVAVGDRERTRRRGRPADLHGREDELRGHVGRLHPDGEAAVEAAVPQLVP